VGPEPSAAPADAVLVALGDSIPYNAEEDCPGCTGFVDSYGAALEARIGRPVTVLNRSRHDGAQTNDILAQLESDENLLAELATADVIVMSIGFNDQPPFIDAYDGCPEPVTDNDSDQIYAERAAATSYECIDSTLLVLRRHVADVLANVREQAPDAGIGALTPYDTWLGWSGLDGVDRPTRDALHDVATYWMHEFREAMCAKAEAVGGVCVDVYSAFNGPDGAQAPTDFVAADYVHPSQEGNDAIRDLLVEANLADD
jgi:lysophospholipase L1-like esterase